jgi:uncharacterized HAD superfamily protein/hypoxanthine phosphoribosyltransferase
MPPNKLSYSSYIDLINLISENTNNLSSKFDLIVGVPRSGMIPAYIIALNLNLPVIDLESFVNNIDPPCGDRLNFKIANNPPRILLVDDSIQSGGQMKKSIKKVSEFGDFDITTLAVYASEDSVTYVDFYFKILNFPRIFQWNLLNSWIYEYSCVDIDGVLCEDPTDDQNDDAENYLKFLLNAKAKYVPSCRIGVLVTNRLEKYRGPTEEWLYTNNIKYNKLIMLDLPDKLTRIKLGVHSTFKSEVYNKNINHLLFIESSKFQAIEINKITGRNVFCVENMTFYPEFKLPTKQSSLDNFIYLNKIASKVQKFFSF